jgi:Na+/pantothenate symporter
MPEAIVPGGTESAGSNAGLITFVLYTLGVFALAVISSRLLKRKSFLSEYFLGSRGLGMWAFALTFAATSSSGGSFMGFPSKIYTHGWILALWIASYMMVPVLTMGLLGKRLNQVARKSGAITIPDVLSNRFESVTLGGLATVLIVFFMAFNLVAQFKAGALMVSTLLDGVPLFQTGRAWAGGLIEGQPVLGGVEPGYLLCLVSFAVAVIVYTTYGGFRAVVWTDVLQGLVMVVGVLIMLPLALWQVGGLSRATDAMSKMTPPRRQRAELRIADVQDRDIVLPFGTWIDGPAERDDVRRVFRTARQVVIRAGQDRAVFVEDRVDRTDVPVLQITTPDEVARIAPCPLDPPVTVHVLQTDDYAYGADTPGVYVSGPGPSPIDPSGFLPLGMAVSFFCMWTFAGAGQPGNMVRLMAFKDSKTLKRGISTVVVYYSLIYFPLVVIFCCARVLMPGMEIESDRIMPAMAEHLAVAAGWPWLAGLLVAAPFAAVMSTVDSFLLMISSALVRDVYHRHINPHATEATIRRLTYFVTLLVGVAAVLGAFNPPAFLQDIIVYTGSGLAACFLAPMGLALYWSRMNAPGAIAGMLAGFLSHLALYGVGFIVHGGFQAVRIASLDPLIPGVAISLVTAVTLSLATAPPPEGLVRTFFGRKA